MRTTAGDRLLDGLAIIIALADHRQDDVRLLTGGDHEKAKPLALEAARYVLARRIAHLSRDPVEVLTMPASAQLSWLRGHVLTRPHSPQGAQVIARGLETIEAYTRQGETPTDADVEDVVAVTVELILGDPSLDGPLARRLMSLQAVIAAKIQPPF
ncbi:hypothetical protein [Aeromicrobium sp. CTD01-1L150]|uniref:hypothetical protein n=1 Tax=Aeromicrobium sp. CTD01-1L150 TaxID=3341830 RepID=UPI0035C10794